MPKKTSEKGIQFIARFEEFEAHLYNDAAGHATIGFGHLVHKGRINGTEPIEFQRGISLDRALELLRDDVAEKEVFVNELVQVELTQDQFDALVSFTFNEGQGAFRDSTVLMKINQGKFEDVPWALSLWDKAGGRILKGLDRRRHEEGKAFVSSTTTPQPGIPQA